MARHIVYACGAETETKRSENRLTCWSNGNPNIFLVYHKQLIKIGPFDKHSCVANQNLILYYHLFLL